MRCQRPVAARRIRGGLTTILLVAALAAAPAGARAPGAAPTPLPPPTPPHPPSGTRVAILSLLFQGVEEELAGRYQDILRAELKRTGFNVIEQKDARVLLEKLGVPPNCTVGPCLAQVGAALGAERALVGGVVAQGSNYDVTLTLLETERGAPVAQALEHCEVCTLDEALRSFGRVTAKLTSKGEPSRPEHQAGASLMWRRPTARPWYQQVGWRIGALSLGAGLIAAGTTLLVLDGSCAEGRNCPRKLSTTMAGASLLGAGALVGVAGATMLLMGSSSERGSQVAFGVGPGSLLLCGRF